MHACCVSSVWYNCSYVCGMVALCVCGMVALRVCGMVALCVCGMVALCVCGMVTVLCKLVVHF